MEICRIHIRHEITHFPGEPTSDRQHAQHESSAERWGEAASARRHRGLGQGTGGAL